MIKAKVHFATQIYATSSGKVFERNLRVLRSNLAQRWISKSTVFLDQCNLPLHHQSLTTITLNRRATYADFLGLAAGDSEESTHLLFANSDILFNREIEQLANNLTSINSVACISRCELSGVAPAGVQTLQSQDAWMIRCQQIDPLLRDQLQGLKLGVAGCEHLLATTLVAHGYDLWNPCLDCQVLHMDPQPLHYDSQQARYWGLYAYIPECRIKDIQRKRPDVYFSFAQKPGRYFSVEVR